MRAETYIDEIDTLRAIAVISVVLYHTFEAFAPSGFIGVDIFFVISGFVISRRYLCDLLSRNVTATEFFLARFRRLAAPAFVVVLATSVTAAFLLTPQELIDYSHSLIAQPFYLQNFVFWNQGDYFSDALSKPLLHTWSLAVEEQFYILFVILILTLRKHVWLLLITFLGISILSYLLGNILETRSPKTVFFWIIFRIWQFSIGIAAFLISQNYQKLNIPFPNLLTGLGIVYLICTALFFDKASSFPGIHALSACLTTALLILIFDTQNDKSQFWLRTPVITHFGKISYSLYLWHWPPLAFFYIAFDRVASVTEAALICLFSYFATLVTVRYVETPVRRKKLLGNNKHLVVGVFASGIISVCLAGVFISSHGLIQRYPIDVKPYFVAANDRGSYRCPKLYLMTNPRTEVCPLSSSLRQEGAILVLGDSHANMVKEAIVRALEPQGVRIYLTTRNCDMGEFIVREHCSQKVRDRIVSQAQDLGIRTVFAISYWERSHAKDGTLADDVKHFVENGFNIALMETVPNAPHYDPVHRAEHFLEGRDLDAQGISLTKHEQTAEPTRTTFKEIQQIYLQNVLSFRPSDILCDDVSCRYIWNNRPIYFDSNHLTLSSAELLEPMFVRMFEQTQYE